MRDSTSRHVAELGQCAQVVRNDTRAADSAEAVRCRQMEVWSEFSKTLSDALMEWSKDPARFETYASLLENFEVSSRLGVNPTRDYGSMPLIVLSSTIPDDPPQGPPERRATLLAEAPKAQAELSMGHEEIAALSRVGVHRSVPNVGHFIQWARPDVVVAAIAETVKTVRAR
jgi:hypothetical protein